MFKFIDGAITLFCMVLLSKSILGDTKYISLKTCIMEILSILLFGVIIITGVLSLNTLDNDSTLKGKLSYKITVCIITLGAFVITWCIFQYVR